MYIYNSHFRNHGVVEIALGRTVLFDSNQVYTGTFVVDKGNLQIYGGKHEFTDQLILQGEKTSLRGPTNDPSSYLTGVLTNLNILNWDYGVINDFTIDIGSQLLLTDLAAMPPKIFTGQIHNKGRVAYTDVVNGLYNDGWSPLIFGLGDRAAYVTNDGTFEISGPFSSLRSSSPHPYSIPRSVGSKFINNGIFRRAGSGSSLIEVDFENNGRLELAEGDLFIAGQNYIQNNGMTVLSGGSLGVADGFHIDIKSGELKGSGLISGSLLFGGSLRPGDLFGTINLMGSYKALPGSAIHVDIGGSAEASYDRIRVSDHISSDGQLHLNIDKGYLPVVGDYFDVISYKSYSGSLVFSGLELGNDLELVPEFSDSRLRLIVGHVDDGDAAFVISGMAAVGQTLTATTTAVDPDGNVSPSYAWQSFNGSIWSAIGTDSSSYTLNSAEEGKQVRVLVTYTDGQGFAEAFTTDAVSVPFVDEGDAAFSITGTLAVGQTINVTSTAADPDGNGSFTYVWQSFNGRSWSDIGTDASSYKLSAVDEGKQIRVQIAYTDGQGFFEVITSDSVFVPFVDEGSAAFLVTGTPAVGQTLTVTNTAADPDGNGSFSYVWQSLKNSSWDTIGTDANTYELSTTDAGKQVRVIVSYIDDQGFSESVETPAVTVLSSSKLATITGALDNIGLLTGTLFTSSSTDDRTPTFLGTLSAPLARGESLRIFDGNSLLGTASVNNTTRTWSYTPTLPVTPGTGYSIVARVSDAAGNLGAASSSFDFVLDTTAPATTASITRLADDVGSIQDTVRSGGHTDDVTPTISGLLSAPLLGGESLLLFNGTNLLGQGTVNNTELTWSFTPNLPASAGTSYSIVARVSDPAGNLGTASPTYRFRLDTAVPTATAAITAINDNVGSVNGNVVPGGATNDRTPTISGTLSATLASGETLRIFADGTLLGTARVSNSSRTWSFTPTLPATPGTSLSITARVVDAAGNLGAVSDERTFTLDSTAPATTVAITAVTDDVGLIQGAVASGRRTDDATPTISGTLSAPLLDGEVLQVFRGSMWVGSASVNNTDQTWSLTPTLAATAGTSYSFTARVADAVGNLGPVSNTRTFILDTSAPVTTATIAAVTDNFGLLQGSISPGDRTNDRSPTFTGTVSGPLASGETLRIFNGSTLLGSATVNNTSRTWTFTASLPASFGTTYAITASVADAAGNLGPASDPFTFSLDTTPNPITGTTNDDLFTLTGAPDLITGLDGSDTIVLSRLSDSLLGSPAEPTFDRITDLITGVDRIDAPVARSLATAVNPVVLGAVSDLTSSSIAALLSSAVFPALTTTSSAGAATFTFNDPTAGTRTFLAINNGTGGFSATTDAIVEITGFSGNLSQLQVY